MRKIFLTTAILFASLGFVFSQTFSNPPCTIAPANTDTGLISPSYDSIACIEQGLPFSASVQLAMPATFNGIIVLDSLVITSITGFPPGIEYRQNPASGIYYADSNGCIAFAGLTNVDSAAYPLVFNGYAVVTTQNSGTQTLTFAQLAQLQDNPVPVYQLNVIYPGDSCNLQSATGIQNIIQTSHLSIYPNPTNGNFNVEINTDKALSGEIAVCDVTGRRVYIQQLNTSGFYKTIVDLSNCAKGFYVLQLKTTEGVVSKSISLQ
jgi:hypothetical protein